MRNIAKLLMSINTFFSIDLTGRFSMDCVLFGCNIVNDNYFLRQVVCGNVLLFLSSLEVCFKDYCCFATLYRTWLKGYQGAGIAQSIVC